MKIITINRQYGAGGHTIGLMVAEKLGVKFYDRDIINMLAAESGMDPSVIEAEEKLTHTDAILRVIAPNSYMDHKDVMHEYHKDIIIDLASKNSCVILGRCADTILRTAGFETLNVFLYANDIHRALRIGELLETKDASKIQKEMKRMDNARASYYQYYTGKHWSDCTNYDMALDTGTLGYDACTELICAAANEK